MKPIDSSQKMETNEIAMTGFVFRENKFASVPLLPFASLAMPYFSLLSPTTSYLDIDSNQFPCSCQRLGWLLAFGKFGYNSHSLAEVGSTKGSGTTTFIKQLYDTAGPCMECDHMECLDMDSSLDTYTMTGLVYNSEEGVKCAASGVLVRNYDDTSDKRDDSIVESDSDRRNNTVNHKNVDNRFEIMVDLDDVDDTIKDYKFANSLKTDDYEKDQNSESETDYMNNMNTFVKEEVLIPQHLRKETTHDSSKNDKNTNTNTQAIDIVEHDTDKHERLLRIPGDASDAVDTDIDMIVLGVTMFVTMLSK
eukprot:GFUD01080975.1.p1 GENE.GFUD01080975.1~~GFUD01080975.1.p1  ORF type:complete len:307 (-),score=94.78 GFUD01080975.1:31-951(-)